MKHIIWTCDTEVGELAKNLDDGFKIFVEGKIAGQEVGVSFINSVANQYGAKITHFVDVYHPNFQREIAGICEKIVADGHCIGLHTHPSSRYGKRYMHEYSYSEQQEIIDFGQQFLNQIGIITEIHRAGGYGANDDTLKILAQAGVKWDSSFFIDNPECKLSNCRGNQISKPVEGHNLLEVPVTVYKEKKKVFGIDTGKRAYIKLDFRYGSDVNKIKQVIDKCPDNSVIILFLHSFNFLKTVYSIKAGKYLHIGVSKRLIESYKEILEYINMREDCSFDTFDIVQKVSNKFMVCFDKNVSAFKKVKKLLVHNNLIEE